MAFFSTVAQLATLREILALLHQWVFEVGFTRPRFHPLHVDSNKTSLSMMGAVSQWVYMDLKYELSHKRDLQWLKFLMALLPPREPTWGPGTQHTAWPQGRSWQSSGGGAGMSCQGQEDGRKVLISSAAVSQHTGFSDKTILLGSSSSLSTSALCWSPQLPSADTTAVQSAL